MPDETEFDEYLDQLLDDYADGKVKDTDPFPQGAAAMSTASFAATNAYIDGAHTVYPASLLFKAGEYPDKQFAITPAELIAAAAGFTSDAGEINLAHAPEMLVGRLGGIRRVWTDPDGETLFGEVAVPTWFDSNLTDEERQVSCEWDRTTKRLSGLALTKTPRVQGAALMAAFTAANPAVNITDSNKEIKRMPTIEEIRNDVAAFFGIRPKEAASAPAVFDTAENDRLKAQVAQLTADGTASRAATFADRLITGAKARPEERDSIIANLTFAANDDAAYGAAKFSDGAESTRFDVLSAVYEARTPHQLLNADITFRVVPGAADKSAEFSAKVDKESDETLALTDTGRAVLAARARK